MKDTRAPKNKTLLGTLFRMASGGSVSKKNQSPMLTEEEIEFSGFQAKLTRKRIRAVNLRILPPNGEIRISAPMGMPLSEIQRFAQSKGLWIKKHQSRMLKQAKRPEKKVEEGELHTLWGIEFPIRFVEPAQRRSAIDGIVNGEIVLQAYRHSPMEIRERALHRFYERQLSEFIQSLTPQWEKKIGVRVNSIRYRRMKSRWGSCTTRQGTIRLNTELAKHPKEAAEYVLVHELVHLIEPSHNKRFWGLVEQHIPEWRRIRDSLNHGSRGGC